MTTQAEELAAAFLEDLAPISPEMLELREQYLALAEKKSAIEREQNAIKELAREEAKRTGVRMFTLEGKNMMGYNITHKKELDKERLEKDFGPKVIATYVVDKKGTQFYCAK